MQIINGKIYADQILSQIKDEVVNLSAKNIKIMLAVVLVGDDASSKIYVNNKMKRAKEVGIDTLLVSLPYNISEDQLLSEINRLNNDKNVHGIIVQLPLPNHISKHVIQQAILSSKDVDGFHPINVGMLHAGIAEGFVPCTPQGCLHLIKTICPNLAGKFAVVIGRSSIVGKPMAALLLQEDATVTICHSKTQNLREITSKADIVVSAMGVPLFLTKDYFKKDAIVIDVGITRMKDGSIAGDVNFEDVKDANLAVISPVPGGVGPMTIAYLLLNVVKAAKHGI